jgi:hypothetical protein
MVFTASSGAELGFGSHMSPVQSSPRTETMGAFCSPLLLPLTLLPRLPGRQPHRLLGLRLGFKSSGSQSPLRLHITL